MAKPLWSRVLAWILDRGAEGVYQDQVVTGSFGQWLKKKIPALLGGGFVTTIVEWFAGNWIPAFASGGLAIVLLMYAKAFINAHGVRHGKRDAITAERTDAASLGAAVPVPSTTLAHGADQPLTAIRTPSGEMHQIRAIGIPRQFILQPKPTPTGLLFKCTLVVDFVSMLDCSASPLAFALTTPSGDARLGLLEMTPESQTKCPCKVMYQGDVKWKDLEAAIVSPEDVARSVSRSTPWPDQDLYFDLELRFPGREAKDKHDAASVRLTFEFSGPPDRDKLAFRASVGRHVNQIPQREYVTRFG